MDKHHNRQWTTHLQYGWWQYALLVILSVLLWTAVFDALAKPERNEKAGIVFFGDGLDASGLQADLSAAIADLTGQEITYVDVYQTFVSSENLGQILMARTYDYDLLVLTSEYVDQLSAYGFFCELPDNLQSGDIYTQEKDGQKVSYGIKIYEPGCQNRFSAFCSGEQAYYVFLSKESVNLAGLNGNGRQNDDAALRMLEYLLEEPYGADEEN